MFNLILCFNALCKLKKYLGLVKSISNECNIDIKVLLHTTNPNKAYNCIFNNKNKILVVIASICFDDSYSGIELAKKIRNLSINAYIIYITDRLEFVLQCYKVRTFDFLPEPVSYPVFKQTFLNLDKEIKRSKFKHNPIVSIKCNSKKLLLNPKKIICIDRNGIQTTIHTTEKKIYCDNLSLISLLELLSPYSFCKSNRSYIINLHHIKSIDSKGKEIKLTNDIICPLSRKYGKQILKLFE